MPTSRDGLPPRGRCIHRKLFALPARAYILHAVAATDRREDILATVRKSEERARSIARDVPLSALAASFASFLLRIFFAFLVFLTSLRVTSSRSQRSWVCINSVQPKRTRFLARFNEPAIVFIELNIVLKKVNTYVSTKNEYSCSSILEGLKLDIALNLQVKKWVLARISPRVSPRAKHIIRSKTLGETLREILSDLLLKVSPRVLPRVSSRGSPRVSLRVLLEISPSLLPKVSPKVSPKISPRISQRVSPRVSLKISLSVLPIV